VAKKTVTKTKKAVDSGRKMIKSPSLADIIRRARN
jgi:hypothetical protein